MGRDKGRNRGRKGENGYTLEGKQEMGRIKKRKGIE